MSMMRSVGEGLQAIGYGIRAFGAACLCVAAFIGVISIEIVLLVALLKDKSGSRGLNGFLLGWLWGSLCFRDRRSDGNHSLSTLFISSFLTSVVAIILSVFLGVPAVGVFIAMIWAAAFAVTGLGFLIEKLGDVMVESCPTPSEDRSVSMSNCIFPGQDRQNTVVMEHYPRPYEVPQASAPPADNNFNTPKTI